MNSFRPLACALFVSAAFAIPANARPASSSWNDPDVTALLESFLGSDLDSLLSLDIDFDTLLPANIDLESLLPSDDCLDAIIDWAVDTAADINWDEVNPDTLPDLIDRWWNDATTTLVPLCPAVDDDSADDTPPAAVANILQTTANLNPSRNAGRRGNHDRPNDDEAKFNAADTNHDAALSLSEFAAAQSPGKPLVEARRKFLSADTDANNSISLAEWTAYKNDRGPDDNPHYDKFDLADLNGNGTLTLAEFAGTRSPNTNPTSVGKKFGKLDKNDDGLLSRSEFNGRPDPT